MKSELAKKIERAHKPFYNKRSKQEVFWIKLLSECPNFSCILENKEMAEMYTYNGVMSLVSATSLKVDEILSNGKINPGNGCMGYSVYAVPARQKSISKYELHNFGDCVMNHKGYQDLTPILFQVSTREVKMAHLNYLKLGSVYRFVYKNQNFLSTSLESELQLFEKGILNNSFSLLTSFRDRFKSMVPVSSYKEALKTIVDINALINVFPSISYYYFESLSLASMLIDKGHRSRKCNQKKELNNLIYILMNQKYQKQRLQNRFEPYKFNPSIKDLQSIFTDLNNEKTTRLSLSELAIISVNLFIFYIGSCIKNTEDIMGLIFYDFCKLDGSNNLCNIIEDLVGKNILDYWKEEDIEVVFNSSVPKGEVGLTPVLANSKYLVHFTEYAEKNLMIELKMLLNLNIEERI
jgi:hypothetical protein